MIFGYWMLKALKKQYYRYSKKIVNYKYIIYIFFKKL